MNSVEKYGSIDDGEDLLEYAIFFSSFAHLFTL